MNIQRPIFVCGFTRGGTAILMNLILSHPKVCKPAGETAQLFKGRREKSFFYNVRRRLFRDIPIQLLTGQNLFDPHWYKERAKIGSTAERLIDRVFYTEMLNANGENENKYKNENVNYKKDEIKEARLVSKNVNGIVYLSEVLRDMYPMSKFVCVVRNGLAICESHMRRGKGVDEVSGMYKSIGNKILKYKNEKEWFEVVKFEDVISETEKVIEKVYKFCNLKMEKLGKIRMTKKPTLDETGDHEINNGSLGEIVWYNISNINNHFERDINEKQVNSIGEEKKAKFLDETEETMVKLGYKV